MSSCYLELPRHQYLPLGQSFDRAVDLLASRLCQSLQGYELPAPKISINRRSSGRFRTLERRAQGVGANVGAISPYRHIATVAFVPLLSWWRLLSVILIFVLL